VPKVAYWSAEGENDIMHAAVIHALSADLEDHVNRWLAHNDNKVEIINTSMSTHVIEDENTGSPISWSNVLIFFRRTA
jgi:hypothetical protein